MIINPNNIGINLEIKLPKKPPMEPNRKITTSNTENPLLLIFLSKLSTLDKRIVVKRNAKTNIKITFDMYGQMVDKNKTNIKPIIIKKKRNSIEVLKTHGDNKKILGFLKIKLARNIFFELPAIIEWYKKKQIWKLTLKVSSFKSRVLRRKKTMKEFFFIEV